MHIKCVTLFVSDNVVYVLSRFKPRGVRKAWAGVWLCGAVFSWLWWGLSVTPVCCCGCVDMIQESMVIQYIQQRLTP